ncbi:AraC family transcriptional regulator [Stutzerimonas stutzeri]|uniref:AraC family transcriptional regulator n=1 Tax=Stutzerimonas stutzeri TaxID=316 RepID=W8QT83_STUST|nr:AraC family transcriptional regulator [Stutzerimonas stutzeri]AHL73755.1 AraC family transcriptional regulator [Stutzerimonas stutzeri]MCQ4328728.1 AraC family transcriptional regulator [Stutzerimonas stutzeri]
MLTLLPTDPPRDLPTLLASLKLIAPLFDAMPEVVFFIKDTEARYSLANRTLAERCGHSDPGALIGLTAEQVFPTGFGAQYTDQDRRVLSLGLRLQNQLELHLYPGREPGWCMTHKLALRNPQGLIIGMAGVSIDLQAPEANNPAYLKLAAVDAHIRTNHSGAIRLSELTAIAGLSVAQLERLCKRVFRLTPRQMIHKARLDAAADLLGGPLPITEIALRCGYADHSAFSRQFRALTGLSPSAYRNALPSKHRAPW